MIRQTWGHSWYSGPGQRRWRSTSVYYSPGEVLIWFLWMLFIVWPLWLAVEAYVLIISALAVPLTWWLNPATRYGCEVRRWEAFWYFAATREGERE